MTRQAEDARDTSPNGLSDQGRNPPSQETYAKKVVEKFGFSDSKRVPTPMHATFHAGDVDAPRGAVDPADLNVDSVLGSIGYKAHPRSTRVRTRPRHHSLNKPTSSR